MQITLSKVYKVYSGRAGCMCGCRGKWACSSTAPDKEKEYTNVSDRSVKIIVGKLLREPSTTVEEFGDSRCFYFENPVTGRTLAAYEAIG